MHPPRFSNGTSVTDDFRFPDILWLPDAPDGPERVCRITDEDAGRLPVPLEAVHTTEMAFGGLDLEVADDVYPPTPVTAALVEAVVRTLEKTTAPRIADVGCGSGALALAVAERIPDAEVHGTDAQKAAVRCSRTNARRLGLERVAFHRGSLLDPLPGDLAGRLDLVVANLPYVPADRVSAFEGMAPVGTAVGPDEDGLGLVRQLVADAPGWLVPGGGLLLQVAGFQAEAVVEHLIDLGYRLLEEPPKREGALMIRAQWPGEDG